MPVPVVPLDLVRVTPHPITSGVSRIDCRHSYGALCEADRTPPDSASNQLANLMSELLRRARTRRCCALGATTSGHITPPTTTDDTRQMLGFSERAVLPRRV